MSNGSVFHIKVLDLGGLSVSQKAAFDAAAARWSQVILGDLPSVCINGQVIDDMQI